MVKTQVEVLKDVPAVSIAGQEIGPFEAEDKIELFCWEARVLARRGDIKVRSVSPAELRKKLVSEENRIQLSELPSDFYWSVRESINLLQSQGRNEEAAELKRLALQLADRRALKLLKLAIEPESARVDVYEERLLVSTVSKILSWWMKWLESFLELGEEVKDNARAV